MKFLGFLIGTWSCVIIGDWALVIFMLTSPGPQQLQATLLASQRTQKMIKMVAEGSDNCDGHGDNASDIYQSDNSELGLDERDLEGWEDVESDGGSDLDGDHGLGDEDEEEFGGV